MCTPLSPELRQLVDRNQNVASLYRRALSCLSDSSSDSDEPEAACCTLSASRTGAALPIQFYLL